MTDLELLVHRTYGILNQFLARPLHPSYFFAL